jgi:hypothetical protein
MDNRKFEQLIDLIINENEEQAKALFHDIVVEKSREIYETMMEAEELEESEDDESNDDSNEDKKPVDESMEGRMDEVGGLLDEIDMEEQGMTEEEDEFADIDVDAEDDGEMPEGDLEDRVVELEDKLDELMAEFEELMAGEEGEDHEFGGDEEGSEEGNPFGGDDEGSDDEDAMMESTNLIAVKNPVHGDNGAQIRSTVSGGPKVPGNGAKAVNFSGESTKGGTQGGLLNPATKDVKGAGSFKNAPGKNNFAEKGEAAPKPTQGDNGVNKTSIVGESKKTVKKIVK